MNLREIANKRRAAARWRDETGEELTVLATVLSLMVVHGNPRKRLTRFEIDERTGMCLLWFLLRWAIVTRWCGILARVQRRALRRAYLTGNANKKVT